MNLSIFIIIALLVLVIVALIVKFTKRNKGNDNKPIPDSSGGCSGLGKSCIVQTDCCANFTCDKGLCTEVKPCDHGYTGSNCQYSDEVTCSAKGTANADGSCTCDDPLIGYDCSEKKCTAKIHNEKGEILALPYLNDYNKQNNLFPNFYDTNTIPPNSWTNFIYDQGQKTICVANTTNPSVPLDMGGKNLCLTTYSNVDANYSLSDPYGCRGEGDMSKLSISPNAIGVLNTSFQRWAFDEKGHLLDLNCPNTQFSTGSVNPDQTVPRRCAQVDMGGAVVFDPTEDNTNGLCTSLSILKADETTSECPYIAGIESGPIFTPNMDQSPEVYYASKGKYAYNLDYSEATELATLLGGQLATPQQLIDSQRTGSQWCLTGWLSDKTQKFPMQIQTTGCGTKGINSWSVPPDKNGVSKSGAAIYGIKPPPGKYPSKCDNSNNDETPCVWDFYNNLDSKDSTPNKYSQFNL
jgi:hypothetical protein